MPQLDFNIAFSNFLFLVIFFILFYILTYFYILKRVVKSILVRKYYLEKQTKTSLHYEILTKKKKNFIFHKILLNIIKN